jgi:hypothetical protein
MSFLGEKAYQKLANHLGKAKGFQQINDVVNWAVGHWVYNIKDKQLDWASGAVSTAYLEAGSIDIKFIGTTTTKDLFRGLKALGGIYLKELYPAVVPERGDIVFFGNNTRLKHVGLIDCYNKLTKELYSLEGNPKHGVHRVFHKDYYAIGKIIY